MDEFITQYVRRIVNADTRPYYIQQEIKVTGDSITIESYIKKIEDDKTDCYIPERILLSGSVDKAMDWIANRKANKL